jgi:hypothetical protein
MACGGLSEGWGTAEISNCTFTGNRVEAISGDQLGQSGALGFWEVESATISDCVFEDNVASGDGGAAGVYNSPDVLFKRCVFLGNSADRGGGIALEQYPDFLETQLRVEHCTFAGNSVATEAADIMIEDEPGTATLEVASSILWSDADPIAFTPVTAEPTATYSDVSSGFTGDGNIDEDPLFVDEAGGDLHLSAGSPCIGTGEDGSDMGAYPYE